ncbi:unnamed protein product [Ostreobium quekettii]|uniref:Uncharacterized protein n=1 Tax=Ostreobium quekettii TaxID=121088 RepID=A0A8S1JCJ7_9CHLO|nr:unnamed protein product [Ostreobium quekettii]
MALHSCDRTLALIPLLVQNSLVLPRRRVEGATGCPTVNIGYPTRLPLPDAAEAVARELRARLPGGGDAFAVTHSMGGVILRLVGDMADGGGVTWRGAVMLGPPNRGSSLARALAGGPLGDLFRFLFGEAACALGETNVEWPLPRGPVGIIAGTKNLYPSLSSLVSNTFGLLKGPNDGTVCVSETRLEGMEHDFCTCHEGHALLQHNQEVFMLVVKFLESASFT